MSRTERLRCSLAGSALLLAFGSSALANDTAAEKAAGGLRFVESETIRMASEDLRISPSKIDITYVFENEGREDETLTVAFPLPAIEGYGVSMQPVELPSADDKNFVGFTIRADGKAVEPRLEERAFLGTKDVTEVLQGFKIGLNPISEAMYKGIAGLSDTDYAGLQKLGLLTERDFGEALWRYEAIYFFEQTFPAGKTIKIEHSYRPVVGSAFLARSDFTEYGYAERFCMDPGTLRAFEGVIRKAGAAAYESDPASNEGLKTDPLSGYGYSVVVPYILKTANNWSGPIGRFHLTIDKASPENAVSLCQDGLRKTGPTTFEFTAENYVPRRDLDVLFGGLDAGLREMD